MHERVKLFFALCNFLLKTHSGLRFDTPPSFVFLCFFPRVHDIEFDGNNNEYS